MTCQASREKGENDRVLVTASLLIMTQQTRDS